MSKIGAVVLEAQVIGQECYNESKEVIAEEAGKIFPEGSAEYGLCLEAALAEQQTIHEEMNYVFG